MRMTMWRALAGVASAGLCAGALSACDGSPVADDVPGRGVAQSTSWTEPDHYAYTLSSSCGERGGLGTFRLWVRDGRVEHAKPLVRGSDLLPLGEMPTIGDVIRVAGEAQAGGADDVRFVRARDGQPRLVSIDYLRDAMDDELCYRVSRLTVLG
jgi:hypothetical protein